MDETVIDEDLVRSLLADQRPDLADAELREVVGGWDNRMWRLGGDLAVRLPRTPRGPALLEHEHRWLPELAPRLPLPVPVPVHLGRPSPRFPQPWLVTTWVAGEPADAAPVAHGPHAAKLLGDYLSALHRDAPDEAPVSPTRRRGPALSRAVWPRRRGHCPPRPRLGGDARHRPDRDRHGRRARPARRQTDLATRR